MEMSYDNLLALCMARKSCRRFKDDPVSEELIDRILALATTSPYASGRKNWKVLVVNKPETIQYMASAVRKHSRTMAARVDREMAGLFSHYAMNFALFERAPLLLVPVFRVAPVLKSLLREQCPEELLQWEHDNAMKSISCVAMLILLAAQSLGLGACYMTGPLLAEAELTARLGLAPEQQIGAVIPVGYPLK
jgi:nitroreductase